MADHTEYTVATFLSSRIIHSHSVEKMPKKGLDFRIAHRFGSLNSGFNEFWGMDESSSYLSLEYGITDWLMAGVGRATYHKTCNGFIKSVILRQSSGGRNMPLTLSLHSAMAVNSTVYNDKERNKDFLSKEGKNEVTVVGDLTIHGVTKNVILPGVLEVKDGKIYGTSAFQVAIDDYKIKVPKIVDDRVAKIVDVKVNMIYEPYTK